MKIEELTKRGTEAVKTLRRQKLSNGEFFMIHTRELPIGQNYIEYPDGRIALVSLSASKKEFNEIRQLSSAESDSLRKRYQLD